MLDEASALCQTSRGMNGWMKGANINIDFKKGPGPLIVPVETWFKARSCIALMDGALSMSCLRWMLPTVRKIESDIDCWPKSCPATHLKSLTVGFDDPCVSFDSKTFPSLQQLNVSIYRQRSLRPLDLSGLKTCTQLLKLTLSAYGSSIVATPEDWLSSCTAKRVSIQGLQCEGFGRPSLALRRLSLTDCPHLKDLKTIASHNLQKLRISRCNQISSLEGFCNLQSVSFCDVQFDLTPLSGCNALGIMALDSMPWPTNLVDFHALKVLRLHDVYLENSTLKTSLENSTLVEFELGMSSLESSMTKYQDDVLALNFPCMMTLSLTRVKHIPTFQGFNQLPTTLKSLYMNEVPEFTSFDGLCCIEDVRITSCNALITVNALDNYTALQSFMVEDCNNLQILPATVQLPKLTTFRVSACDQITKAPHFLSCPKLEAISFEGCQNLHTFPGSDNQNTMSDVSGCVRLLRVGTTTVRYKSDIK
jgi:hypothetical protein